MRHIAGTHVGAVGYTIEQQGAVIRYRDRIRYRDALDLHTAVYNHPRHERVDYLIIDAMEVEQIDDDVPQAIAATDRGFARYNPSLTVLFVYDRPALEVRFREYRDALRRTGWTFRTFPSLEQARAYLSRSAEC